MRSARLPATAAAVLVLTYLLFVCTGPGQQADNEFWALVQRAPQGAAETLSRFVRRQLPVISGIALVAHVIFRRRWRTGLFALFGWVAVVALAYALREVLPRPFLGDHGGHPVNSFPSTHVALVATPLVAVLLDLLDSSRTRITAVVCWALIAVAMVGNTLLLVHRASDTIGAMALGVLVLSFPMALTKRGRG